MEGRLDDNRSTPLDPTWQFDGADGAIESSPTIVNGTVYVGSSDGSVYAVDFETGTKLWEFDEPDGAITGSPTVDNGVVYVGSHDETLYAIDAATGEQRWAFDRPSNWIYGSPTVVGGTVYVGALDSTVYAVDTASGTLEWRFSGDRHSSDGEPMGPVASSVTVVNRTVYVSSLDGSLYALDAWNGKEQWEFEDPEGELFSSPTVANETVFVGSHDESLYAVDAETGEKRWSFYQPDGAIPSTPTVDDGVVYVGSADRNLYAVDAETGVIRWAFSELPFEGPEGGISSSPTVAGDTVYIGADDGIVYAVDETTGDEIARFDAADEAVRSSPTVVDGTLVVGSDDGNLTAFDTGGSADSDGSRVEHGTLGHVHPCPDLELADSNDDCIPDVVASADLHMPEDGSDVAGDPIELDPTVRDSSGDGIHDHVLLDIEWEVTEAGNETHVDAAVTDAIAHPSRIDSTGDGLTDYEQLVGWKIAYTSSLNDTVGFFEAVSDAEDLGAVSRASETYMTHEWVTTDPLRNDTSGDGLSDREEQALGTDPRSNDTTGDGSPDVEAGTAEYDPTLFEVSPPLIEVDDTSFEPDNVSASYQIDVTVEDPTGIEAVEIRRDGDLEASFEDPGTTADLETTLELGPVDAVTDLFTGATITVEAADYHGNEVSAVAREQNDVFGDVSHRLSEHGLTTPEIERHLGTMSGASTGLGETIDLLRLLYHDPLGLIPSIREVVDAIENYDEIIEALPEQVHQQQELNNPHDSEAQPELYQAYREGWYAGYVTWFVFEAVVPAGEAAKAVKSVDRLDSALDRLSPSEIQRAAKYASRSDHTRTSVLRHSRYQISQRITSGLGVGQHIGEQILGPVRSSGRQVQVADRLRRSDIDSDQLESLSAAEREGIGSYLARGGDESALKRALDVGCPSSASTSRPSITSRRCTIPDEWYTDGAGIRLIEELNDDSLQAVLDLDVDRAAELRSAFPRKHADGYATADEIGAFARHVNEISDIDGINSGPVKDFITANSRGNVDGALREVAVAADIGADSIERMNIQVGPKGVDGELDIKLKSGQVVETKPNFGRKPSSTFNEIKKKLTAMKKHDPTELDGNTLTIRAAEVNNVDDVQRIVDSWEKTVRESGEWNNAAIDLRVIDDSIGEVVAD
ncbi:PQQ-binding-like beta-propeller repeat protein [Halovivax limisalsi]|uniref:outer membrane protein assembly factor BamB family protein n=1 Tax=Halovivax limisalsi TaxID=1453760 RepID=UPI001FFCAB00|nr:PQQ-binding-like beta-propeller repeat protein [Halovivax limisalsi]